LLLIDFSGYELDQDLLAQTKENCRSLEEMFRSVGVVSRLPLQLTSTDPEHRTTHALRSCIAGVLERIADETDIVLDVSSLPRVVYLTLITAILEKLVPDKQSERALYDRGVNFQVLVAEDPQLDARIRSEDPSDDLVTIPGFGGGINVESMSDWPVVWFPMLGEGRTGHFEKVAALAGISDDAEVCPVVPHPAQDPRRGDELLLEYRQQLFDTRETPTTNIVYAHESHPFEAYRQVRLALDRYRASLNMMGGCRLLVTPLASKLMTIAGGLACFDMKPPDQMQEYALGIPYAAPRRYVVSRSDLNATQPTLALLLLTGAAYSPG